MNKKAKTKKSFFVNLAIKKGVPVIVARLVGTALKALGQRDGNPMIFEGDGKRVGIWKI